MTYKRILTVFIAFLFVLIGYAQQKTITGTVSSDGIKLSGVDVVVKGTANGVVTDFDGSYSIDVDDVGAVLMFSYIGFEVKEEAVDGRNVINTELVESTEDLSEIVVVGYGTQKKTDLTGAVETITSEDITRTPVVSLDQSLGGQVAGVFIANRGGDAAAPINVRIRGVGTTGSNQPLFVVDGVPLSQEISKQTVNTSSATESNPLASINPNDIESISVLKDASAGAIYGARAANGVVIITTKRGRKGQKAKFNYDVYTTVAKRRKFYDVLNTEQYLELQEEVNNVNFDFSQFEGDPTYDWQEAVTNTGVTVSHNLGVAGGGENSNYSISAGYLNQSGITLVQDFERYSFKANSDIKVGEYLKFGESINVGFSERLVPSEPGGNTTLRAALNQPFAPIYDADQPNGYAVMDDETVGDLSNGSDEPSQLLGLNDINNNKTKIKTKRIIGNIYGEVEPLKGLKFKTSVGVDYSVGDNSFFQNSYFFGENDANNTQVSLLIRERPIELTTNFSNTLTYDLSVGKHNISLLFGHEESLYEFNTLRSQGNDLTFDSIQFVNVSNSQSTGETADHTALRGYLGRLNYVFDDRYLFTFNIRRDETSRFHPDKRVDYFPSLAFGWNVANESFMNNQTLFDRLKLKASWGEVGNQQTGKNFAYLNSLSFIPAYVLGSNQDVVISPTSIVFANEDLRWETSEQTNFGIEAAMFNNKLSFTAEYYIKQTKDILVSVPLPAVSGFTFPTDVNLGEVSNKGVELSVDYSGSIGDHFTYNVSGNFSTVKNNVESLGGNEILSNAVGSTTSRTVVGEPIGQFFGYVTDGLYQTQEEVDNAPVDQLAFNTDARAPGDVKFVDTNGDGVINENDRQGIGSPIPTHFYGFNLGCAYKGFDFSIFFQGVGGNDIYNYTKQQLESLNSLTNKSTAVLDRWNGPNSTNDIPRVDLNNANNNDRFSDRWIENGSYLRLKNIQIGYSLNSDWLKSATNDVISNVRIYVAGQNLAVFTKYSGLDPEVTRAQSFIQGENALATGIDDGYSSPQPITFQFGTRITF